MFRHGQTHAHGKATEYSNHLPNVPGNCSSLYKHADFYAVFSGLIDPCIDMDARLESMTAQSWDCGLVNTMSAGHCVLMQCVTAKETSLVCTTGEVPTTDVTAINKTAWDDSSLSKVDNPAKY